MNYLAPDIQNILFKAARQRPASFLFTGGDERSKTLAAETLAAHYDLYLFPIKLAPLLTAAEAEAGLQKVFNRADKGGDLLYFQLPHPFPGNPQTRGAMAFFLGLVSRFPGVVILSLNEDDGAVAEGFRTVVHFPAREACDKRL